MDWLYRVYYTIEDLIYEARRNPRGAFFAIIAALFFLYGFVGMIRAELRCEAKYGHDYCEHLDGDYPSM